ncbi:MAG: MFS transporter [Burkholderiales bacterium]|nr:MFS transporter [Burkholderiales bacterium]
METPHPRTAPVFAAFVAMLVLAALDQTILSTALPAIARELHGADRVSWVFSAYLMASTVAIPLYGRLADIHGSKPVLVLAITLFGLGSLAGGLASDMTMLIAARAIQGAGGGGLMTLTLLGMADLVPSEQLPRRQALLGASYGLATMFGPLIGGAIVENGSWQWTFFMNVPVAALALTVVAWGLPRRAAHAAERVDWLGAALLGATLATLLLATRRDASTAATWGWLAMSAALALSFVWRQRRSLHPIVPPALFASRAFVAAAGLSALAGVALFAGVVFLPLYLQTALALSPTASAWHLLPLMAGLTTAAITGGRALRAQAPVRAMALAASGLMALSFAALVLVFRFLPGQALALSVCVLPLGIGTGLLFPLVTMLSRRLAPVRHVGAATAAPVMLRALGGALGVSALGALLAQQITERMAGTAHAGYAAAFAGAAQPVYAIVALLCLLGGAAAFAALPRRTPQPGPPIPQPA